MDVIAFVTKKILSAFLYPLGISAGLSFLGFAIWKTRRACGIAMFCVVTGAIFLVVMSLPITATLLLGSIEKEAGPYADAAFLRSKHVRYIVVLGGAGRTARLSPADRTGPSIFRVMEGVRLWKGVPGCKLVLSGMGFGSEANNPALMGQLAIDLGVPRDSLIVKAQAWDTCQEARLFSKLVGREPFALVTSAYHIPRAMMLFQMYGLNPIASPCEFKAEVWPPWYSWVIPGAKALWESTLVIHEYIGMIRAKLHALLHCRKQVGWRRTATSMADVRSLDIDGHVQCS